MRKKIDGFTLILVAFISLLALLFGYLVKIGDDVQNYNIHQDHINTLMILDKKFDSFMLKKLTYANYDEINALKRLFAYSKNILDQNQLTQNLGKEYIAQLHTIELLFSQKSQIIEDYKSDSAAVINSIHYLFDAQKNIASNQKIDQKTQKILNDTLFLLIQTLAGAHTDFDMIKTNIVQIRLFAVQHDILNLLFFNMHANKVIQTIKNLNALNSLSNELDFYTHIESLHHMLDHSFNQNLFKQKVIASLFFFSSFLMLIILIIVYRRSLKTRYELSAFKYAVEHSDNSIVMTDLNRNIVYVNDIFEKDTGYTKEEVIGENPRILKSDMIPQKYYDDLNSALDRGEKWEGEFINKRKDGSIFYEKASIVPVFIDDELVNFLAIKLNITDYILQQEKLKLSATAFENTQESVIITDENEIILSVNKAFETMTGYSAEEAVGKTPKIIRSNRHNDAFYSTLWNSVMEKGYWKGKIYDRTKAGEIIPTWLSITAIKNDEEKITNYIAIHTSLQEIVKMQERADYLAYHDSLTHLPNRINFEEHLQRLLNISKRNNTTLAILFIDLDRFKVINDTLGHHVGDGMLKTVAKRVKSILRDADMLARIGGDEFVIVLDTIKHDRDAAHVSEKVLATISMPIKVDDYTLNTTASIGIAIYPHDGEDISTIIKHADSAMYHAKDKGKNNYQFYTEQLSVDVHNRLEMEQALQSAIADDELYLLFQPQYDLATKKVIGAEALLRWQSKTLGNVSPADFIPVAEDTGAIIHIGRFVFKKACQAFLQFKEAGLSIETIAVNVSSIQFRQHYLLESFKTIINMYDISPKNIELEITERYIMEFTANNMSVLEAFRKFGFKISIDDFGTGYSSMSYLKKLPLDTIKVDKSFIDDIPGDINGIEITKAIIALSKSLGYSVIAEGIENTVQEDFLLEHGCDIGQGYLFGRPVTSAELIQFVKEREA